LLYIVDFINSDLKIFIETSSGQGSELCYKLEDLVYFFKKLLRNKKVTNKFMLCLDTCHLFSSGYDLTTIGTVKMFFEIIDELIGINKIGLIHLNDSKTKIGSRIDRHECLGKGYIGMRGLIEFCNYASKYNIPIILETETYEEEIKLLTNIFKN